MPPNLADFAGLTILGTVAILVFRTLWRQESSWQNLLEEYKDSAKKATDEALLARKEAHRAWEANTECERRYHKLTLHLKDLGLPMPDELL